MRFVFGLVIVPLVALPVVFILMPSAWGALLWQVLSMVWMLIWFKKGELI